MSEISPKNADLPTFLESLFDDGRVLVAQIGPIPKRELPPASKVLARFEQEWRREMPRQAPRYCPQTALWMAVLVYRAAQFTVFRDAEVGQIRRVLGRRCPTPVAASAHYSADLTLRFLPELTRLARCAAADDPLVGALRQLAAAWPLSSVGMPEIEPEPKAIETLLSDASLLRLYVDRIVERKDLGRLNERRVLSELELSAGAFPELLAGLPKDFAASIERREIA